MKCPCQKSVIFSPNGVGDWVIQSTHQTCRLPMLMGVLLVIGAVSEGDGAGVFVAAAVSVAAGVAVAATPLGRGVGVAVGFGVGVAAGRTV